MGTIIEITGTITKGQVAAMKARMFMPEYVKQAKDEEALGIAISQYTEWDGGAILRTLCYALEDANFHGECAEIQEKYPWAFEKES
jgi:hypothetical protein